MPRLVVLNGPPGCGKSTMATRYIARHPMALGLEIDQLRRQMGGWLDNPLQAGLLAREVAFAASRTHLEAGRDVVVPQYFGRVDHLGRFEQVARDVGCAYVEIVLMDGREVLAARFLARNAASAADPGGDPQHAESQRLLERHGGAAQLGAMYDRLLLVIAARPQARVVAAPEGEIEQTWQTLLATLRTP